MPLPNNAFCAWISGKYTQLCSRDNFFTMGNNSSKHCKSYRPLSPTSDGESSVSSVHSNPSVGKRLSQLESAPSFPQLNAPRLPSPVSICSVLPPSAQRRDSPTDDATDEFILSRTRPSDLVEGPKKKPSVKPALSLQMKSSFPPANPTVDKGKGQRNRLPVQRHQSLCLPSEKSTVGLPTAPVVRPELRQSGQSSKPVYPPKGPRIPRQNHQFSSAMQPVNEEHSWCWNLIGQERTGRIAEKDVRNMGKRITEDLCHVMAQPLAQQEGYKLEVRLTKIRVGNQEGPVYGENRHSHVKEEKIYSVPTRRNLAARQLHEDCLLSIDPVCRKTKSSQQQELVRLVAQNHERNNVAIKPSRKDLRDITVRSAESERRKQYHPLQSCRYPDLSRIHPHHEQTRTAPETHVGMERSHYAQPKLTLI
ncbi:hypothetical protein RvY_08235 [Ramazzottius varieornatus]|uniref:Uncharacterized protein n=1 Tax=Ramazzottius varieornatus TaxID=947166 RepID=A0A1D1V538_RAMVA|nr:hypothetical protein RvY_08235 [Ramazzottius varieornatus]